jgi:putative solute:sodium symporter small subunit
MKSADSISKQRRVWLIGLLIVWFVASFGCGILWRSWLDTHAFSVGYAPFGFWMAQQGSIMIFVLLLILYAVINNRLDRRLRSCNEEDRG